MNKIRNIYINNKETHIWKVLLRSDLPEISSFFQVLSDDEKIKGEKFYFMKDRMRFWATHSCLRKILSYYVDIKPNDIQFSLAPYGKPYLIEKEIDGVNFNVSHSENMILIAIGTYKEIGIDVEYIRRSFDFDQIVQNYFHQNEQEKILACPLSKRYQLFFTFWTRKEAFIKATGQGLSFPLNWLDVSWPLKKEHHVIYYDTNDLNTILSFRDLHLERNYFASLAVEGPATSLKHFDVSDLV